MSHIFPDFEKFVSRQNKQQLLNQKGIVLWFTGLSGSGKSTIAASLDHVLHSKGFFTAVLDGDNVRTGINANLGFSEADRTENIRRIAEISKLFVQNGAVVICCFVSPLKSQRALAASIIGDEFHEVFVNTPLEECEERDVKGLYKKARAGEIKDFTGISSPFEAPESPFADLKTKGKSVDENVNELIKKIEERIVLN